MNAVVLAIAAGLITLGGGLAALRLERMLAWIVAFCAGALIAAACVLLLPDAIALVDEADRVPMYWVFPVLASGFFVFFLLENSEKGSPDPVAHHGHAHATGTWGSAGIALHGFIDGIAIGQAFDVSDEVGFGIASAILVHKFSDGVSVAGIMRGTRQSPTAARWMIGATAVAPLAGLVLGQFLSIPPTWLGMALAWFAGVFLYLGTTSLLPAAYAVSDSRTLPLATLGGALLVSLVSAFLH